LLELHVEETINLTTFENKKLAQRMSLLLESHSICCQTLLGFSQDTVALKFSHTQINVALLN